MNRLYPLKFDPIIIPKIWGGSKLHKVLGKSDVEQAGESWELSGIEGSLSVIANGEFKGQTIKHLIETEGKSVLGEKILNRFGAEFPLLIKFIDAADDLSVQVHPDDEMAGKKHNKFGKTEMWYVVDADNGAVLNCGFNVNTDRNELRKAIDENKLLDILNFVSVNKGDTFFIPAGTVHAIGKGMLIAEIQQTSDVTYRLFDFNRKDADGNYRELHIEDSLDAINYQSANNQKIVPSLTAETEVLVSSRYFKTNLINISSTLKRDIGSLDSFVIYICVDGVAEISYNGLLIELKKGEVVLMPAECKQYTLSSDANAKLLEVYID